MGKKKVHGFGFSGSMFEKAKRSHHRGAESTEKR
jgi:hypothetical protein